MWHLEYYVCHARSTTVIREKMFLLELWCSCWWIFKITGCLLTTYYVFYPLSISLHQIEQCCSTLESRLQGVGEVQSHVRDVFSRLADLDDELDSLSPVGRDADSLASQADALKGFLTRLTNLRSELEGHSSDCTSMLRREGSSPDLLALRRETEALNRQAGKVKGGRRSWRWWWCWWWWL